MNKRFLICLILIIAIMATTTYFIEVGNYLFAGIAFFMWIPLAYVFMDYKKFFRDIFKK